MESDDGEAGKGDDWFQIDDNTEDKATTENEGEIQEDNCIKEV